MSIKTFSDLKAPWFHMRGSCVYDVKNEWQNSQFVTVLDSGDYAAGDSRVLECAKHFKTDAAWKDHFNKSGNFGTTARGELSFGDAFAKLLKCHGMLLDSKTVAPGGITFNGYNTAVSSIESRGKGGIILGTYIVGRLALSLSKDWASVRVGYYDIPCLGSDGNVVSCRIRETDFSIRRPHKPGGGGVVETDEKIIVKFLKFALSLSDLSFPNVCEIYVYCGQPVNGRISMDQISEELAKATEKKTPYANPNIFYEFRSGAQTMKTQFLLRPLSDELTDVLRNCKYQPCFFGKTNNRYWGDYLVSRAMQTPFDYGKTVEETAINCIKYCIDHKWANYPASMVAEDVGGTTNATEPSASSLLDMEDAPEPAPVISEPAEPVPVNQINLAALADVDWSLLGEEETESTAFVGDVSLDEFGEWTEEDDFGEWTEEDDFAEDEEDVVAMFDSAENDASYNPLPEEYEDLDSNGYLSWDNRAKSRPVDDFTPGYDSRFFSLSKSEITHEREKFRGRTCDDITGADIKTKKDLVAFMRKTRRELYMRRMSEDNFDYCAHRYMNIVMSSTWWQSHRPGMIRGKFANICDLWMHLRPQQFAEFLVTGRTGKFSNYGWTPTDEELCMLCWDGLKKPIRMVGETYHQAPEYVVSRMKSFCDNYLGLHYTYPVGLDVYMYDFVLERLFLSSSSNPLAATERIDKVQAAARETAPRPVAVEVTTHQTTARETARRAQVVEAAARKTRASEEAAAREEKRKAREAEDLARKQARAEEERKRQAECDARKAKLDAENAARKAKRQQESDEFEAKKARRAAGEAAFDAWKHKWGTALGKVILKHRNIFATLKGTKVKDSYWANPYAYVAYKLVTTGELMFDYPNVEVKSRWDLSYEYMGSLRDMDYARAADAVYKFYKDFLMTFTDACRELAYLEIPEYEKYSVNSILKNAKELQDNLRVRLNNHYEYDLRRFPGFKRHGLPLFNYACDTAKSMYSTAKGSQPTII